MPFVIEKDWVTRAGLRAVVIMSLGRTKNHRCGYVAVPEGHAFYGKGYSEQLPEITQDQANNTMLGSKSPILALTAGCDSDGEDCVRRSLDVIIDVHGGITYSSNEKSEDYPVASESPVWWFGFDCAHYMDNEEGGRSQQYCEQQCESMAQQFQDLVAPKLLTLDPPEQQ